MKLEKSNLTRIEKIQLIAGWVIVFVYMTSMWWAQGLTAMSIFFGMVLWVTMLGKRTWQDIVFIVSPIVAMAVLFAILFGTFTITDGINLPEFVYTLLGLTSWALAIIYVVWFMIRLIQKTWRLIPQKLHGSFLTMVTILAFSVFLFGNIFIKCEDVRHYEKGVTDQEIAMCGSLGLYSTPSVGSRKFIGIFYTGIYISYYFPAVIMLILLVSYYPYTEAGKKPKIK